MFLHISKAKVHKKKIIYIWGYKKVVKNRQLASCALFSYRN